MIENILRSNPIKRRTTETFNAELSNLSTCWHTPTAQMELDYFKHSFTSSPDVGKMCGLPEWTSLIDERVGQILTRTVFSPGWLFAQYFSPNGKYLSKMMAASQTTSIIDKAEWILHDPFYRVRFNLQPRHGSFGQLHCKSFILISASIGLIRRKRPRDEFNDIIRLLIVYAYGMAVPTSMAATEISNKLMDWANERNRANLTMGRPESAYRSQINYLHIL